MDNPVIPIIIEEIKNGFPGLTSVSGHHLFEACVVCLTRKNHKSDGTNLTVSGEKKIEVTLIWENIFDDQLDRTWADQFYATEHGAVCLSVLLVLKLTDYTIIEKSARKNGFDYWLGKSDDILFQKKARLEVSGIFDGSETKIQERYNVKLRQTGVSDDTGLPAFIGIVEFSKPTAKFSSKN